MPTPDEGSKKTPVKQLVLIPLEEWSKVKKKFPILNDSAKIVKLNDDNNIQDVTEDTSPPPPLKLASKVETREPSPPPPPPSSPPPREREGEGGKGGEIKRTPGKTSSPKVKKKDAGVWRPPGKIVKGSGLHISRANGVKQKKKNKKKKTDKFAWISL